jgi:dTMP kinase
MIGKYIVIEGPEGVGKTTQILEIARRLQAAGLPVRTLREPDSQSDLTARAIRQLTQDPRYPMNTRTEVLLYNAARAQSLEVIKQSVAQGVICLVDRNYLTTLAIQYYGRGDVPDYPTINSIIAFAVGAMEPDLCVVMDAPASVLKERAGHRGAGERFDNLDEKFLERVRAGYLWEAHNRNMPVVFATRPVHEVSEEIWKLVSQVLAVRSESPARSLPSVAAPTHEPPVKLTTASNQSIVPTATALPAQQTSDEPLVTKDSNGTYTITSAGKAYLDTSVTNTTGNVYAFTDKLTPVTIAAAMARLSRRGDDMRITILDEFAGKLGKDEQLLKRVITAYGDDSVQQLAGLHFVIENATKYMTNILEWGRFAAYLEQSTRYIYFDQKDSEGRYRYYVPTTISGDIREKYIRSMDAIFELYSKIVHKLTDHISANSDVPEADRDVAWKGAIRAQACDAARLVLPTSTTTTVGVYTSGQALESLIMHLQSNDMQEARDIGDQLLIEARKVIPTLLERADQPERGGALIAYRANTRNSVAELARKKLVSSHSDGQPEHVTLTDVWPRNELDIVADMLYEHSQMPLRDIRNSISSWSYDDKQNVMTAYFGERLNRRHRPGRALEKVHYSWDLVCDFGIFCDLMRHRVVDDMEWQELTPRYGFETPKVVEEAGLTSEFEECFSISLKLHSLLQSSGHGLEAQYATLLGHQMRWKITYNAREAFHLHELRTSPQGHPGYRKLVQDMHNKVREVHPIIADAMKFVNKGEDEALTRLAAERYTQFKLQHLQ